ncbi:C2 domain-containing protein [Tribonema minus]|uniref:C2 domain-containing protein n=1 Tax=Tribonema minus TaxID=303371 RepID=A0A835YN87_9STRA|nr:C2 domain-containing protein [Tribonema minus]
MFASGSDPFLVLRCNGAARRTATQRSTLQPVFDEHFDIDVTDPAAELVVECWDEDSFGSDFIGVATVHLR